MSARLVPAPACVDIVAKMSALRIAKKNELAAELLAPDATWTTPSEGTATGRAAILALWAAQDKKAAWAKTRIEEPIALDKNHCSRVLHVSLMGVGGSAIQHFESKNGLIVAVRVEKL